MGRATEPKELPELNRLAVEETGEPVSPGLLGVWADRIAAATGRTAAEVGRLPIAELPRLVRETAPPAGLFGTRNTMGELLRVMEIVEGVRETSPEVARHARSRLAAIKTTSAYRDLAAAAARRGYAPEG